MKHLLYAGISAVFLSACTQTPNSAPSPDIIEPDITKSVEEWIDLSKRQKPDALTNQPWQEVVISVTDLDRSAQFFTQIGGFETVNQTALTQADLTYYNLPEGASGQALTLRAPGADFGHIRLIDFDEAGPQTPMRPGARAWDTGCYFSLMMRMKDMSSIYDDSVAMGWWTETPMTYLEFGTSKLNIMIFRGPDGVQVQGYERLEPPLPDTIAPFERLAQPFNIMQMVRERDAAYDFFQQKLGFETFYYGKPYVDKEPSFMPLGIPKNLTTTIPYRAAITYPVSGEYGRMEMISIDGLDGRDHSKRCIAPNLGILSVRFPVDDIVATKADLVQRDVTLTRDITSVSMGEASVDMLAVTTPDGAMIEFYQTR